MAYSSVNRMNLMKQVTKKQPSMSNYGLIIVSSRAPVSLCSEGSQNDHHPCKSMPVTFPLLDAVQDVVATLFDEHGRVVLSSCHDVRVAIRLERVRNVIFDKLGRKYIT